MPELGPCGRPGCEGWHPVERTMKVRRPRTRWIAPKDKKSEPHWEDRRFRWNARERYDDTKYETVEVPLSVVERCPQRRSPVKGEIVQVKAEQRWWDKI